MCNKKLFSNINCLLLVIKFFTIHADKNISPYIPRMHATSDLYKQCPSEMRLAKFNVYSGCYEFKPPHPTYSILFGV